MLERDPELDAMLAPERQAPPPPPAALNERLWKRISDSVRSGASPARGPIGPALLIITGLLGVAVGGWAVSSLGVPEPTPRVEPTPVAAPATAVEPAPIATVEVPRVEAPTVEARAEASAPVPTREPDAIVQARPLSRDGSRRAVRAALEHNRLLEAAAALTKHEANFPQDDVREERDALLVLTAAFSQSPELASVATAFRTRYPRSSLLIAMPRPTAKASNEVEEVKPSAQGCSLSGRVTFSSRDPKVKASDLVVYLKTRARSVKLSEPRRHEIAQKDLQFTPRMLIIQKNDSVSFPNRDNKEHSVFTSDRTTVRISPTKKAEPEPVAFLKEGGFRLQCDIHANMRAWVVVVPVLELATTVADDGTWRIDHVPKGAQVLKVLEPNGNSIEVPVTACAGDSALEVSLEGHEAPLLRRFNGSPYGEYQQ
ncbi:MAG: hypothetical protein Q8L14_39305 [Myxococcales bacterium]|nr:hypothetical protein [Myxococcales bacterium]